MKDDIVEIKSLSSEDDNEEDQSEKDSDENDNEAMDLNTIINPLALKPVFVSKVDREMLDPSI